MRFLCVCVCVCWYLSTGNIYIVIGDRSCHPSIHQPTASIHTSFHPFHNTSAVNKFVHSTRILSIYPSIHLRYTFINLSIHGVSFLPLPLKSAKQSVVVLASTQCSHFRMGRVSGLVTPLLDCPMAWGPPLLLHFLSVWQKNRGRRRRRRRSRSISSSRRRSTNPKWTMKGKSLLALVSLSLSAHGCLFPTLRSGLKCGNWVAASGIDHGSPTTGDPSKSPLY